MSAIILIPVGSVVHEAAVPYPIVTTTEALQAVAAAVEALRAVGVHADVLSLLQGQGTAIHAPTAPEFDRFSEEWTSQSAEESHAADLARIASYAPSPQTWGCECGKFYDSIPALHAHRPTCPVHAQLAIPKEYQTEGYEGPPELAIKPLRLIGP